ncbi:MAG: hypothetical protein FJZ96_01385 [Chloroflexi bacterium]|nr:hypothetical protein [Chloroflexota bacterium]
MKKSDFERMIDRTFGSLEANYKFKRLETTFRRNGATVRYENATTGLVLSYEIGDEPWLTMVDLNNTKRKSTLGWLLVEQGVAKSPTPKEAFQQKTLGPESIEPFLQKMSSQLQEHGAEILKGDFSIFPKLQGRAQKYAVECKRYADIHKMKP